MTSNDKLPFSPSNFINSHVHKEMDICIYLSKVCEVIKESWQPKTNRIYRYCMVIFRNNSQKRGMQPEIVDSEV